MLNVSLLILHFHGLISSEEANLVVQESTRSSWTISFLTSNISTFYMNSATESCFIQIIEFSSGLAHYCLLTLPAALRFFSHHLPFENLLLEMLGKRVTL